LLHYLPLGLKVGIARRNNPIIIEKRKIDLELNFIVIYNQVFHLIHKMFVSICIYSIERLIFVKKKYQITCPLVPNKIY
jgi:hypothetical protein